MSSLSVVTQPNNVPSGPLSVVNQPQNQPQAPLQVQSTPAAPQPASIPVQSQPTDPEPQSIPVQNAPSNQPSSIAVPIPPLITAIQTALNRGSDPTAILQEIGNQNPDQKTAISDALSKGTDPSVILQQIVQQNGGITADSPLEHVGLLQSLVQMIGRPIVGPLVHTATRIGQAIAAPFNPAAGEQDINVHVPVLGDFNVPAQNKTSFRQEVGNAAKVVSLGIENPAIAGATYGFGDAQENKRGIIGTAAETGLGALGGKLGDKAVGAIFNVLSKLDEGPAAILINSLIKPVEKEFRFGKNPGLGVAQEKIVANSLPDLEKQITQRLSTLGEQIGQKVATVDPAITADYSAVLKPFDDAINEATKGGPNNQALVTRLQNAKDALTQEFEVRQGQITPKLDANTNAPVPRDLTALSAQDGNSLKQEIGGLRKWNGTPSEDTIYNKAVTQAYHAANDIVEQQAPGTKALNSRYANLLSAQSAIERRTNVVARQNTFGLFEKLGFGEAALSLAHGDYHTAAASILAALANKTLGSTAFKARAAAALSTVPEISAKLFEANPELKAALSTAGSVATKTGRYVGSRLGARAATAISP